jgi:hypothetical protein
MIPVALGVPGRGQILPASLAAGHGAQRKTSAQARAGTEVVASCLSTCTAHPVVAVLAVADVVDHCCVHSLV